MKNFILFCLGLFIFSCSDTGKTSSSQNTNSLEQIDQEKADYLAKAQDIATQAQQALGEQLKTKLEQGGPLNALDYCAVNAIPLTDSLSKTHNIQIRRVTDKPRNRVNLAEEKEKDYIDFVREQLANAQTPIPVAQLHYDRNLAYIPIITNPMCLQCHGVPGQDIKDETYNKITQLYSSDRATGYADAQIRGIWIIEQMKR
ncbi:MAG: DUF3365 domain-containing protein [Flavobacteriaceae bacterium]|nr:DUF3365 domain-containing protein [Flavobacteriaceae bacterium]